MLKTKKYQIDGKVVEKTFKLVDATTGAELDLPFTRTDWQGNPITVADFNPSRFIGNEGFVFTSINEVLVPSVVNTKIVEIN
jgi:hypothetical protein